MGFVLSFHWCGLFLGYHNYKNIILRMKVKYYTLRIHFFVPFSFVSTLYPVLYPSVSKLDSILSPPVSMLDLISSWFYTTLIKFPTRSLVEVGSVWRLSMCFHPIIRSQNFDNRYPCRALVRKSMSMSSMLQYAIDILLLLILFLEKK